ncbi:hypothetical protein [Glycomyces albidus]|uniref:Uncharacterized protein n=1 Tax=Glycomyces albidus TaxID=2656774 RepID=A0A6L5G6K5_9ACTN|nr:hypothetical protein [Glycomyces albidus]MQM25276.1 hypothetical protein [Glycomyces albidus]
MSTPDETQFEEAFAEFAHAAELMVDPVDSAVIHGRVRRRRTTKGAMAAALAALIVAVPAAWWLQESKGDEVDLPPADETTAETTEEETASTGSDQPGEVPEGQESGGDEPVLPTFADLVGAELELPQFLPGSGEFNDACPVGPAVLADGTPDWESGEWSMPDGPVWVLKVVHTALEEGGPVQAVALLGCRPGEGLVRQAVVVAGDGDGGWEVTDEILVGDPDGFALYDIAPAATTGVLLMVLDHEPTGGGDGPVGYEIHRYRTGQDLEVVTDSAYLWGVTDIAASMETADNGDGTWTATLTVTNAGDHESHRLQVAACRDSELLDVEEVTMPLCSEDYAGVDLLDPLEPGESVTVEWTLTPAPVEEWSEDQNAAGLYLNGSVRQMVYSVDGFVYDYDPTNSGFAGSVTAEDMA